jgi:hypothetical protein
MADAPVPTSALAKPPPADISSGVFSGIAAFEAAQRMAHALCSSSMVPTEYRGQQGLSNSLIALEIAARMGLSPLVVMQNMTPIHGRPSWSSSFLIATVNASGRFTPLRFVFDDKEQPSWCYAIARDKATGELLEGQKITIEMAKREGWWSRRDRNGNETSKWASMTGQMLRYRAASFWVRVFCPEISLGLMTQEEALEVEAVAVRELDTATGSSLEPLAPAVPEPITRQVAVEHETPTGDSAASPPSDPAKPASASPSSDPPGKEKRSGGTRSRRSPTAPPAPESSSAAPVSPAPPLVSSDQPITSNGVEVENGENSAATPEAAAPSEGSPPGDAAPPPSPTVGEAPMPVDLVASGIEEIPRLTSLEALDAARNRVSKLLAAGRIHDEGAERLWAVIDKRRQQLQSAISGEAP